MVWFSPLAACGGNSTQAKPFEFEVVLGESVIVAQGEPLNFQWGYFNFPGIRYSKDGNIVIIWEEGTDSVDNYTCARGMKVSLDGGYKNADGNPVKSVVTRTITIVPKYK